MRVRVRVRVRVRACAFACWTMLRMAGCDMRVRVCVRVRVRVRVHVLWMLRGRVIADALMRLLVGRCYAWLAVECVVFIGERLQGRRVCVCACVRVCKPASGYRRAEGQSGQEHTT